MRMKRVQEVTVLWIGLDWHKSQSAKSSSQTNRSANRHEHLSLHLRIKTIDQAMKLWKRVIFLCRVLLLVMGLFALLLHSLLLASLKTTCNFFTLFTSLDESCIHYETALIVLVNASLMELYLMLSLMPVLLTHCEAKRCACERQPV